MPVKTAKAQIALSQNDEGLWMSVEDKGRSALIFLGGNHGPIVNATLQGWADRQFQEPKSPEHTRIPKMQRLLAYVTGTLALLVVATSAVTALTYAVLHRSETLLNLATSTLTGVGMAIGGCLGSALLLRFKVARKFVKGVLNDINDKHR